MSLSEPESSSATAPELSTLVSLDHKSNADRELQGLRVYWRPTLFEFRGEQSETTRRHVVFAVDANLENEVKEAIASCPQEHALTWYPALSREVHSERLLVWVSRGEVSLRALTELTADERAHYKRNMLAFLRGTTEGGTAIAYVGPATFAAGGDSAVRVVEPLAFSTTPRVQQAREVALLLPVLGDVPTGLEVRGLLGKQPTVAVAGWICMLVLMIEEGTPFRSSFYEWRRNPAGGEGRVRILMQQLARGVDETPLPELLRMLDDDAAGGTESQTVSPANPKVTRSPVGAKPGDAVAIPQKPPRQSVGATSRLSPATGPSGPARPRRAAKVAYSTTPLAHPAASGPAPAPAAPLGDASEMRRTRMQTRSSTFIRLDPSTKKESKSSSKKKG